MKITIEQQQDKPDGGIQEYNNSCCNYSNCDYEQ